MLKLLVKKSKNNTGNYYRRRKKKKHNLKLGYPLDLIYKSLTDISHCSVVRMHFRLLANQPKSSHLLNHWDPIDASNYSPILFFQHSLEFLKCLFLSRHSHFSEIQFLHPHQSTVRLFILLLPLSSWYSREKIRGLFVRGAVIYHFGASMVAEALKVTKNGARFMTCWAHPRFKHSQVTQPKPQTKGINFSRTVVSKVGIKES